VRRGEIFCLRLTTASAQCLRLSERIFILKVVISLSLYGLDCEVFNDQNAKKSRDFTTLLRQSPQGALPVTGNWGRGKGHCRQFLGNWTIIVGGVADQEHEEQTDVTG